MASDTMTLPPLPISAPSGRVSGNFGATTLRVGNRPLPVLSLRIKNGKVAAEGGHFPLRLHAVRAAYFSGRTRSALKLSSGTDLVIVGQIPEVLGDRPLAVWQLTEEESAALARANAGSGALLVEGDGGGSRPPVRWIFSAYWLDWLGWSGVAPLLLAQEEQDDTLLRSLLYELGQRRSEAPTGLHTARARLFHRLGAAAESAEACVQEILLALSLDRLPGAGALDAAVLLGRLLKLHDEPAEAWAAFAVALWINPNHHEALVEALPVLDEIDAVVDALARLEAMPHRPQDFPSLTTQSALQLGMEHRALTSRVGAYRREQGKALWATRPAWLNESSPSGWLHAIGI